MYEGASFFTIPCFFILSFWMKLLLTPVAELNNQDTKLLNVQKFLPSYTNKLNEIIHLTRHSKTLYENIQYGKKTSTLVILLLIYICIFLKLFVLCQIYLKKTFFYKEWLEFYKLTWFFKNLFSFLMAAMVVFTKNHVKL